MGGGQFDPESGGHFGPECPGHFKSESGGQFERNLQYAGLHEMVSKECQKGRKTIWHRY